MLEEEIFLGFQDPDFVIFRIINEFINVFEGVFSVEDVFTDE